MFRLRSFALLFLLTFLAYYKGPSLSSTFTRKETDAINEHRLASRSVQGHVLDRREKREGTFPCLPDEAPKVSMKGESQGASCMTMPSLEDVKKPGPEGKDKRSLTSIVSSKPQQIGKRADWDIREIHNRPETIRVPTERGGTVFWRDSIDSKSVDVSRAISTEDLCGCTALIVSSPYVTILVHIWEARGDDDADLWYWFLNPPGPGQQRADREHIKQGMDLLDQQLSQLKGPNQNTEPTLANSFNGWLPKQQTTVITIAPQWDPDYYNTQEADIPQMIRYDMSTGGYVYPSRTEPLKKAALEKVVGPNANPLQASDAGYRRRYWNDIMHGLDDRDLIAVAPAPHPDDEKKLMAMVYYNDFDSQPIARLGDL